MAESLTWNRARDFLRGKYGGGGSIKKMISPAVEQGIWMAEIIRNGCIVKVEFRRKGRRWIVLSESPEGDEEK